MVRLLPLLSIYFLLYCHASWTQTTTATLLGTVKDSSGAVLIGAEVELRNLETGFTLNVTTDPFEAYFIAYIPSGSYRLTVESPGFKTEVRDGLRFEVGQEVTIEVALRLSELEESVTVRGEVAQVEITKSVLDWMVTREQIDDLSRNAGRELHWWQLDARLSKKFVFDRYRLELMAEAFNLDNHINYTWTMGNLSSSLFGQPIAADPARQVQLAIRFQF